MGSSDWTHKQLFTLCRGVNSNQATNKICFKHSGSKTQVGEKQAKLSQNHWEFLNPGGGSEEGRRVMFQLFKFPTKGFGDG